MTKWHSEHDPRIELTRDEMLEISQEISQEYAPDRTAGAQELVLLPVDPYHMYVYWNLEEEKGKPSDLTLRVYWRPDEERSTETSKLWFDVALQGYRNQCQIQLPIDQTAYSAELGWRNPEHELSVIVDSNVIHVPRGRMAPQDTQDIPAAEHDSQQFGLAALEIPEAQPGQAREEAYDEAQIDAHIRQTLDAEQVNEQRKASAVPRGMPVDERGEHAEAQIDAEIRQTLQEKGLAENLESLSVEARQSVQAGNSYSEAEVDTLIKRTLHEKGYSSDTRDVLGQREAASEQPHHAGSNPPVQGNRQH